MDKKKLALLIDEIINDVATNSGVSEEEARTMVGISLRHNRKAIVGSIKIPTFDTSVADRGRRGSWDEVDEHVLPGA